MPLTNAGAQACLKGPGLFAATRYASLHTGAGIPTSATELTVSEYSRLEVTPAEAVGSGNRVEIAMQDWINEVTQNWGDPTILGWYTAENGGTLLAWSAIQDIDAIVTGDRVYTEAGDIAFALPLS